MAHNIPQWLNKSFFEKVLRTSQGDKILKISEINVASTSNFGEHYASSVFKATVKHSDKFSGDEIVTKLFVKRIIPKVNAFTDENSFDTELNMYIDTIPDMERLLSQSGEKFELAPRLLYSAKDPEPVMVFEDVMTRGFGMSSGLLCLEGTKFVTRKIAKLHAASLYMERDGKGVQCYKNGLFNLKKRDGIGFMKNNMGLFIDEVKTWDGFETVHEKLEELFKKFEERGSKVYTPSVGYNVLNHGDFHYKNMAFKKDDIGKLSDVLFLDFQLAKWGSPSIDIFYLLYMVASQEVRENNREELIHLYYDEFISALNVIGYMNKPPALLDLHVELLKNGFLEVLISICFLPYFYMDTHTQDPAIAFENGVEGVNLRKSLYKNHLYKQMITKLIPDFLYKGLLN